jgi:hypothetical protein
LARIRTVDVVWLLFLGGLAAVIAFEPSHTIWEWVTLFALGAVQIAEPHLGVTNNTRRTLLAIGIKMGLCFWLVWSTGGLESSYYFIFLLPIVSCASTFEISGSLIGTAIVSGPFSGAACMQNHHVPCGPATGWIAPPYRAPTDHRANSGRDRFFERLFRLRRSARS